MRENFDKAITLLFDLEGYISDDPNDKGGFTKWGISQKYHPDINVPKLTREEAIEIYRKEYWEKAGCDELTYPLDVCLFIQAVNLGMIARTYMAQSNGLLDFFMLNLNHYATRTKVQREVFLTGWCNRLIRLWEAIQ